MAQAELEQLDQKILEVSKGLCQQLGISNYSPTLISWASVIPRGRAMVEMPLDECLLLKSPIMLPAAMRSKLEPEEWKPILASTLIQSKKLRKKILGRVLVGLAIMVAISALLFFTLPALLPTPVTTCRNGFCGTAPLGYMIWTYVGIALPFIGTPVLGILFGRRVKLTADRQAADLVGLSNFLSILNKIANVSAGQVQTKKHLGGPLSPFPTLGARIANLQEYSV